MANLPFDLVAVVEDFYAITFSPKMPVPMGKTFAAWKLGHFGGEMERHELAARTLDEAIKLATPPMFPAKLMPKGGEPSFVILETDDTAREGKARQTVHFYTVKARREYRLLDRGDPHSASHCAVPYAVYQGSLPMNAFDPRRPFQGGEDNAANGRQPGEARLIDVGVGR